MIVLQKLLWLVVALGVLIVVHEYGHYLAARFCNVKVLRFSVGFGRPLFSRKLGRDATEWVVAAIPFGGYVKMLDEREGEVRREEAHRAFNRQSVWRRVLIVVAGPLFNFLFAIAVYSVLYMQGMPELRPVLGEPLANSPAKLAGIQAGEAVRAVNGEALSTWEEFRWRVLKGAFQHEILELEVIDDGQRISIRRLDLSALAPSDLEGNVLEHVGATLFRPRFDPVLGYIDPGSPAMAAGLQRGDRVLSVNGERVLSWQDFVKLIQRSPAARLNLAIEREGRTLAVPITPEARRVDGKTVGRIGAGALDSDKLFATVRYGPGTSVAKAAQKTWEISVFSLRMLGKMILGEVSWKHLSGPVTIADYAGQSAQMGVLQFVLFLALISISLGVLNLLPIPLLDGGHLMYYAVEIMKGSPVSERAMEVGQRVGLGLLLFVMAFAFYNDLNRVFSG